MAIPFMEEDVEVISKLGDTPGSDDGLTPAQLKGRFDLAGIRIKNFLNNQLIPYMNQLVDVQALLNGILDATLTRSDKAAPANVVGLAIQSVLDVANSGLPKSGGIMTGGINMSHKQLTNVPDPVNEYDAANRRYVNSRKVCFSAGLSPDGWDNKQQVIKNPAITENSVVFFGINAESADAGIAAGVRCVAQAAGQITISCKSNPRDIVLVDVVVWN